MAKMTVAQIRERQVHTLASYKSSEPTEEDLSTARTLMNSYYRLCGLCDRNLYLANEAGLYNEKRLQKSEEREERWVKSLSKRMQAFCGLIVDYFGGYLPEILEVTGTGRSDRRIVIAGCFYE